jgi:hypothetical protein
MTTTSDSRMTSVLLSVRMTPQEKARLATEAKERGMKISEHVRDRLFSAPVDPAERHLPKAEPSSTFERRVKQLTNQGMTSVTAKLIAKQEGLT